VAVFAADTTVRSLLDPGDTMHWSEFDRGGHFPALEVPELLVAAMGRPQRFRSAGRFKAFTGLTLRASETGETDRKGQAITRPAPPGSASS
jgi:hypothetical protein